MVRAAVTRVLPGRLRRALGAKDTPPEHGSDGQGASEPRSGRGFYLTLPAAPGHEHAPLWIRASRHGAVSGMLRRHGLADFQPEAVGLLLAMLERFERGRFFDVGSNVGPFCLVAAALTDWQVTAFEPTPDVASALRRIRDRNGLTFDVEELALAERPGMAQLYRSTASDSTNSLLSDFRPWDTSVEVRVTTLDEYCRSRGVQPRVLKIDTEATEPAVLAGATDLLERVRPWIICEVLADRTEAALDRILAPLGYRFHHLAEGGTLPVSPTIEGDPRHRNRDWLFAPEAVDDDLLRLTRTWYERLLACRPS